MQLYHKKSNWFFQIRDKHENAVQRLFAECGYLSRIGNTEFKKIPFSVIKNSLIDFQNLVKLINEIAKFDSFNVSYDNILDLIFYFLFNSERHNEIHIYEKMLQIPNKTIYSFVSRWQMKSKRENIGWETTMVLKGSDYDYGSDYDNSIEAINAYVMTDSIEDTTYDVTNDDISYAYYDECEKGGFIEKIRYLFYTKNSDIVIMKKILRLIT